MTLIGKKILLVNSGSISKLFILEKLNELGISIICIDKEIKDFTKNYIDERIIYKSEIDLYDKISSYIKFKNIDGVITYWEDDVLLTSKIVDKFGFKGNNNIVANNVRNKYNFRNILNNNYFNNSNFFSCKINSKSILIYKDIIKYPCIIKPIYGASSCFVTYISNFEELNYYVNLIETNISTNIESALKDGIEIFVENYFPGDEIDIDVLVQDGEIKFFSITDNLPSLKPFMIETGQSIPSKYYLSQRRNIYAQLIEILNLFGIKNSCLHFEAKVFNGNLFPIEINLRMGGDEVYYFVKESFGIDLIENSIKIALGIEIDDLLNIDPISTLYGEYIIPNKQGILKEFDLDDTMFKKVYKTKKIGDKINIPPTGFDFLGWVIVQGNNYDDCISKIEQGKGKIHVLIN